MRLRLLAVGVLVVELITPATQTDSSSWDGSSSEASSQYSEPELERPEPEPEPEPEPQLFEVLGSSLSSGSGDGLDWL
eukprot:COSAG05_NODE_2539_length_2929_cov_14.539223_5_plen_77_part_01